MRHKFYIYLLKCSNRTFYVGKGSGRRLAESVKERVALDHLILCELDDEKFAYELEFRYITLYREWGYELLNSPWMDPRWVDVSSFCKVMPEEQRDKIRQAWTPELKARLAEHNRKRFSNPEEIEKLRLGSLKAQNDPRLIEANRVRNLGRSHSEETKKLQAQLRRDWWNALSDEEKATWGKRRATT